MSVALGVVLSVAFLLLGASTSYMLWEVFGWPVFIQVVFVLSVATAGEHYVSGKGYYHYTPANGLFVGRVPFWIPLMWLFAVQASLLVSLPGHSMGLVPPVSSGFVCMAVDLLFVEPYLCAQKELWQWAPVERGYFSFIPESLDRFTAPPGNYIVWFVFPVVSNLVLWAATGLPL